MSVESIGVLWVRRVGMQFHQLWYPRLSWSHSLPLEAMEGDECFLAFDRGERYGRYFPPRDAYWSYIWWKPINVLCFSNKCSHVIWLYRKGENKSFCWCGDCPFLTSWIHFQVNFFMSVRCLHPKLCHLFFHESLKQNFCLGIDFPLWQ